MVNLHVHVTVHITHPYLSDAACSPWRAVVVRLIQDNPVVVLLVTQPRTEAVLVDTVE